jgi:diacylglycerol kinase family enzyme
MPASVILNTSAGTGELHNRVISLLSEHHIGATVENASTAEGLGRITREALARNCSTIIAGGGDGTIGSIAAIVAGRDVDFGVLPLGTLNHFAKDLHIPLGLDAAVANLVDGTPQSVDVAQVNGRIFVNNSGLGLYPSVVKQRKKLQQGGQGKWTAFIRAALNTLRRFPFLQVRIEVEGQTLTRRTPFLFVGNNMYQLEGFALGSRESLSGGELCICVAHRLGRWGLVRLTWHALIGRLRENHEFDVFRAPQVTVTMKASRVSASLDGELHILQSPLQYETCPGALRVIVPQSVPAKP